ncbi:ABC transporter substrate-binding protein, partial [Acidianus sp. DSM 29099]|nr:ABC transporter substrate-binding protein [Acidianus sp. RZ1]
MDLTLPMFDVLEDIIGSTSGVKASFAGNQWFVVRELVNLVKSKGIEVYVETIPPGIVRKRAEGEPLTISGLSIDFKPEVISLPPALMEGLDLDNSFNYASNDIVIAYRGKEIVNWCDL